MRLLIANIFWKFNLSLKDPTLGKTRDLETRVFLTVAPKKGELDIAVTRRV